MSASSRRAEKEGITSAPALAYPRFDLPFILATDASEIGLGAVLSEQIEGQEHVVAFASGTLHPAEEHYSATEKEALAFGMGHKRFRPYLFGRRFMLVNDHRPLYLVEVTEGAKRSVSSLADGAE